MLCRFYFYVIYVIYVYIIFSLVLACCRIYAAAGTDRLDVFDDGNFMFRALSHIYEIMPN